MKRFIAVFLAFTLACALPALAAGEGQTADVSVNAPSAVLMERLTGTVLYTKMKASSALRLP